MLSKKRILMFSALSLIVLTFSSVRVSAQGTTKRLWGMNRYETSAQISNSGWTKSDYAVIASGENFPDALGAAPLAKKYNAPILLTQKDTLDANTASQLSRLGVEHVFIVGGPGAVSSAVENQLKNKGIVVDRFYGSNRYETSISIAKQMGNPSEIVIATGEDFSDGLTVGPIAANKGIPFILVPKTNLPSVVKDYIADKNISKTYVIGGNDVIDDTVASQFPNVERITGSDRYQRNANIINKFSSNIDFSKVCIASGENFPDALSGTAYAALNSSPVFLVSPNLGASEKSFISSKLLNVKETNVLGGEGAVSQAILNSITTPSVSTGNDDSNIEDDGIDLNNTTQDNSIDLNSNEYNLDSSELK